MNIYIGTYIGFGIIAVGIILAIVATILTSRLDKYATIPDSYKNTMMSAVLVFFTGLLVVIMGLIPVKYSG